MTIRKKQNLIVFTDLDGTLLDHTTYGYDAALPALSLLKRKKIPLILCSSKTAAELECLRIKLRLRDPFISENGGAIFIPHHYFNFSFAHDRETAGYAIIELGTPYSKLREILTLFKERYPGLIHGFGDMGVEDVARLANLSPEEARLAKQREYDEPFLLRNIDLESEITRQARSHGVQVSRGSRFYHLLGGNDKGRAVAVLTELFRRQRKELTTIGLGDSLNDLPMLETVDYPVLVQKYDGSYDPALRVPNLILARGQGPKGFAQALSRLVRLLA